MCKRPFPVADKRRYTFFRRLRRRRRRASRQFQTPQGEGQSTRHRSLQLSHDETWSALVSLEQQGVLSTICSWGLCLKQNLGGCGRLYSVFWLAAHLRREPMRAKGTVKGNIRWPCFVLGDSVRRCGPFQNGSGRHVICHWLNRRGKHWEGERQARKWSCSNFMIVVYLTSD